MIQREEEWHWHFYLGFSKIFVQGDAVDHCKEVILDDSEETNICAVLQRCILANSILFSGVLIGLIFKALIIFYVLQIFRGKFYRFTNFLMLISGLSFNLISIVWWIAINDLSFVPKNEIRIGLMFFVIPIAGVISLICYCVMRTYTRMFDVASFANELI